MQPYELFGKILPMPPTEKLDCAVACPLRDGGQCDLGAFIAAEVTGLRRDPDAPNAPIVLVSPVGYLCMRDVQPPDAQPQLPPAGQGE